MDQQTQTEQASEPSVQERIANIFSDEPPKKQAAPQQAQEEPDQPKETEAASEEQTEETAAPADDTFELEIDGEKYTLPKKLEKGFMQERDYTQKSQTLAEQRRALEIAQNQQRIAAMQEGFQKEAAQELEQLKLIEWSLQQPVNWASMTTEEKLSKSLELQELERTQKRIQQAVDGKRKEWGDKQAQEIAKLRAQSLDVITKKIPGWSEATAKEIRQHALSEGYTEEELNAILDPRHAVTLWKAQQFDKLKASAQKSVTTAKAVKTTPSNPMPQKVKDQFAFRKAVSKVQPGSPEHQRLVRDRIGKIFG